VLISSPVIGKNAVSRLMRLAANYPELMVVVDHPVGLAMMSDAAEAAGIVVNVVIDLDVGLKRTGALPGKPALELAELIMKKPHLKFCGLQAFAGCTHVPGFENRRATSLEMMGRAVDTRRLLEKAGIEVPMLSGGSTGTYNIDSELSGVTEQQVGSYVFMDVDYRAIGGKRGPVFNDFEPALWVISTVVSHTYKYQVTVDAGLKSFATDRPYVPEVRGIAGVRYAFGGDEHGRLYLEYPSQEVKLGDRLDLMVTHCDPNVNLFDRIFCLRGNRVETVWTIEARGRS
jgi:D-serine deaminase-like pyridoxal phosphate-dependent protein